MKKKSSASSSKQLIKEAAKRLGYSFKQPRRLLESITHKSYANEMSKGENIEHNQRLEFLGDAVLNLIVSEMLLTSYPEIDEGELSRQRAFLVNQNNLSQAAAEISIGDLLRLGKGEEQSGGRDKTSLLADLFEAILGAIYLEGGMKPAKKFVEKTLGQNLKNLPENVRQFDPKSQLQELFQKQGQPQPCYKIIKSEGPDHQRRFTVAIVRGKNELGLGTGPSKKMAEQNAASELLKKLTENSRSLE